MLQNIPLVIPPDAVLLPVEASWAWICTLISSHFAFCVLVDLVLA